MSGVTDLLRNSLSYFVGRMAVLLAGLISLPLMTRLLTKEEYGLMSLVFLAITISTSLSALGFPQATTRYFSEYAERGQRALSVFCSTMLSGAALAGIAATVAVALISLSLLRSESFADMALHLRYAAILILVRIVSSVFLQIFRGNQQTFAFNLINIANRYLSIGLSVLLIIYVYQGVTGVFVGVIVIEMAVMLFTFGYFFRRRILTWIRPNPDELRRAMRFGVPLVFADLMVSLVASSDRFVIQHFLGAESVAVYSVAYDISDYVAIMFASPLQLAILPIVYSLWSKQGEDATRAFLNNAVNLSIVVVIPMIVGFSLVGPDLVTMLASEKYLDSGRLVPYIALGVMLGSMQFLFFTGLLLREKTKIISLLNGTAALANLALNIVIVPKLGIIGAAYSTIFTYLLLNTTTFFLSGRHLMLTFDWTLISKSLVTSAVMAAAIWYMDDLTGIKVADLALRVLIGVALYGGLIYLLESRVRELVWQSLAKLRS